ASISTSAGMTRIQPRSVTLSSVSGSGQYNSAGAAGCTMTVSASLPVVWPSFAVSVNVYVPSPGNVAVVAAAAASANVTPAGSLVHAKTSASFSASVAEPDSCTSVVGN